MMKKISRFLLIISIGLFLISSSCDKENNYPKNSILGSWLCQEESSVHGYRQYNVNIDYHAGDTSMVLIYNFYNIFSLEVTAILNDTIITITNTDNPMHDFTGTGHIKRDYSAIFWEYSYLGQSYSDQFVQAVYRRP